MCGKPSDAHQLRFNKTHSNLSSRRLATQLSYVIFNRQLIWPETGRCLPAGGNKVSFVLEMLSFAKVNLLPSS